MPPAALPYRSTTAGLCLCVHCTRLCVGRMQHAAGKEGSTQHMDKQTYRTVREHPHGNWSTTWDGRAQFILRCDSKQFLIDNRLPLTKTAVGRTNRREVLYSFLLRCLFPPINNSWAAAIHPGWALITTVTPPRLCLSVSSVQFKHFSWLSSFFFPPRISTTFLLITLGLRRCSTVFTHCLAQALACIFCVWLCAVCAACGAGRVRIAGISVAAATMSFSSLVTGHYLVNIGLMGVLLL